jgi:hypothetical protein
VPVEAKPIFRPDVVRLPLLGFNLPEQVTQRREKLKKWTEIISSGSFDANNERGLTSNTTAAGLPMIRFWMDSIFRTRTSAFFGTWPSTVFGRRRWSRIRKPSRIPGSSTLRSWARSSEQRTECGSTFGRP